MPSSEGETGMKTGLLLEVSYLISERSFILSPITILNTIMYSVIAPNYSRRTTKSPASGKDKRDLFSFGCFGMPFLGSS